MFAAPSAGASLTGSLAECVVVVVAGAGGIKRAESDRVDFLEEEEDRSLLLLSVSLDIPVCLSVCLLPRPCNGLDIVA